MAEQVIDAGAPAAGPVRAAPAGPVPVSELERLLGIELAHTAPDRVVGSMPVDGNRQPFGVLHGGASCVLAETLASVAACLHFAPGTAAGTEISATHLRPVSAGRVTGTATALRLGRTHASYEITITDESGRRVCSARMTCVAGRADGPAPPNAAPGEAP